MNVHQKAEFLVRVQATCTKKVDFSDMTNKSCTQNRSFCSMSKGAVWN
jgi:hypothetical protein